MLSQIQPIRTNLNRGTGSDATATLANSAGSSGTATVTGAGSTWTTSGALTVGASGNRTLTVQSAGSVSAQSNITLASLSGSIGTLNIGAPVGSPAAAPGTLVANTVAFGAGTGTLVFNHTSSNYVFSPAITGTGTIDLVAGNTIFTGDMSAFTSTLNLMGG
jgi:T5SS/PEP-CTERM-associated repeat protein